MKKTLNKILHIVVDVLVVVILIISVLILTMILTAQGEGGVPSVFGKAPISVITNSMHGDAPDSFDEGDLLICDVIDHNAENEFNVGDVVTFRQDINGDGADDYVTHRIYKKDGGTYLTKGDNNVSYDQDPNGSVVFKALTENDFVARYTGTKISGFGSVVSYLQTPNGFFLCILLPMIFFFLYQAVRVVVNVIAYNKEKAMIKAQEAIANSDLTEEQKAKAIEEYLASQQKAPDNSDKSDGKEQEPEQNSDSEQPETEQEKDQTEQAFQETAEESEQSE